MSAEAAAPSPDHLSIVTVNIRFDAPEDGAFSWEHRLPLLAAALRNAGADIIGTQEGWHRQIRDLSEQLPGYHLVDAHREWDDSKMYPCLFLRSETLEAQWARDAWLSRRPQVPGSRSFGSAFPRILTLCRARRSASSRQVILGCLHLDHLDGRTRRKQAAVAIRQIRKAGGFEKPTLLLGDFNEAPSAAVHELILKQTPLVDPWETLGLPDEATFHGYGGASEVQRRRIDWVLTTPDFEAIDGRRIEEPEPGRYLSDHHPVFVRLRLR